MKNKYRQNLSRPHNLQELIKFKKNNRKFKYYDYIAGIEDEIKNFGYVEMDIDAYRVVTPPPDESQFEPQIYRPERLDEIKPHSPEKLKKKNDRYKEGRFHKTSVSLFDTPENANKMANLRYKKDLERNMSKEEALSRRKAFGTHIIKVHITKWDGLITLPDEIGHMNFMPYEGTFFKDMIDNEFKFIPITYEDDE